MTRVCGLAALLLMICARGEAPELKAIHPVAAAIGSTNKFTLSGKFEPWPPKFWISQGDIVITPETNKNKVAIEIPATAKPGARLIRAYNADGVSEPKFFVVGVGKQVDEKEPNDRLAEAQEPGELPTTINGRLDKNEDSDAYRVSLKKGEWLEATVEAYTLMSKVDAVLRLTTTNGITIAWNHDHANFDPRLSWRATEDTTVLVQVFGFSYPATSEVRLSGGEESYYRLHLAKSSPEMWCDSEVKGAQKLPFEAKATVRELGQEIRYEFAAKKNDYVVARVEAGTIGSALDPWLNITDAAGKQLARDDDSDGTRDPKLEWKAPADTNYFLVVGSVLNRAGSNHFFRITADIGKPDVRATFSTHSLTLKAGDTNNIKIDFKRLRDHTNDIAARVEGLPPGVKVVTTNLPAKNGEVSFPILTETNAPAFSGPLRLFVGERAAVVELTTRGENNGVPNGYSTLAIESYEEFWLTVKTNAPAK